MSTKDDDYVTSTGKRRNSSKTTRNTAQKTARTNVNTDVQTNTRTTVQTDVLDRYMTPMLDMLLQKHGLSKNVSFLGAYNILRALLLHTFVKDGIVFGYTDEQVVMFLEECVLVIKEFISPIFVITYIHVDRVDMCNQFNACENRCRHLHETRDSDLDCNCECHINIHTVAFTVRTIEGKRFSIQYIFRPVGFLKRPGNPPINREEIYCLKIPHLLRGTLPINLTLIEIPIDFVGDYCSPSSHIPLSEYAVDPHRRIAAPINRLNHLNRMHQLSNIDTKLLDYGDNTSIIFESPVTSKEEDEVSKFFDEMTGCNRTESQSDKNNNVFQLTYESPIDDSTEYKDIDGVFNFPK